MLEYYTDPGSEGLKRQKKKRMDKCKQLARTVSNNLKWQARDLVWRGAHLTAKVPWMSPKPGEDEARSELNLLPTIYLSLT